MQFHSYLFLFLFLPVTLAGYFALHHFGRGRAARVLLILASLLFYGYGNPWYLPILLGSAGFNWVISRRLGGAGRGAAAGEGAGKGAAAGKGWLAVGIAVNAGLLLYFKYANFFIENWNLLFSRDIALLKILLPVGISFFTFQQIAWLVDSYRGETKGCCFLDYLLFTVYFPKIAMGPILLQEEFIPQLHEGERHRPDSKNLAEGLMLLAAGLFKKVILAEFFAGPAGWGFAWIGALSSMDAFLVMLAYTFQLYLDFSGYCDMAVGISRMFNLSLPQNFDSPYKAMSPVDFWKRWHMTLTRFLRKYLYFPLGGSRRGKMRTYGNILIVFLVSGLWHGANWTFVVWGLLHGLAQAFTRAFHKQWERLHPAFQWLATFLFVNLTWVVFRADSLGQAKQFFGQLCRLGNTQVSQAFLYSLPLSRMPAVIQNHRMAAAAAIYGLTLFVLVNTENLGRARLRPTLLRGAATVVMLVWSVMSLAGVATFIYFQF